jgi:predicted RNase H-like HicB family nuclease
MVATGASIMKRSEWFTVDYERDADGWWVASVRGLKGCHTQGRTIEQARERIREALALVIGDVAAERAELRDDVKLPLSVRRMVQRAGTARAKADAEVERAAQTTRDAVKVLAGLGLSARDAGELLGLSRQRVNQIMHGRR